MDSIKVIKYQLDQLIKYRRLKKQTFVRDYLLNNIIDLLLTRYDCLKE